jgi:pyridoxine 5-phosphate synthase
VVELHTGTYCEAFLSGPEAFAREFDRIAAAARYGKSLGLEIHAGHGLSFATVKPVARLPEISELNIGHFLVGEAIFVGLAESVRTMRRLMNEARAEAAGTMPA